LAPVLYMAPESTALDIDCLPIGPGVGAIRTYRRLCRGRQVSRPMKRQYISRGKRSPHGTLNVLGDWSASCCRSHSLRFVVVATRRIGCVNRYWLDCLSAGLLCARPIAGKVWRRLALIPRPGRLLRINMAPSERCATSAMWRAEPGYRWRFAANPIACRDWRSNSCRYLLTSLSRRHRGDQCAEGDYYDSDRNGHYRRPWRR
jgi:hypothetical protein